jgi:hypothetical protein
MSKFYNLVYLYTLYYYLESVTFCLYYYLESFTVCLSLVVTANANLNHVCRTKRLVCGTFPLSVQCSILLGHLRCDFWLVLCKNPGYNNNSPLWCQIMEQQHRSLKELRLTEMQCEIKQYLRNVEGRRCSCVWEDDIKLEILESWAGIEWSQMLGFGKLINVLVPCVYWMLPSACLKWLHSESIQLEQQHIATFLNVFPELLV